MGTIKDRNSTDLTEAEEVEDYTEETVQKNVLVTQITMMLWSFT